MNAVTAAAPGKVIVTGEHAVVYGRPALVGAIDLWLRVTMTAQPEEGLDLRLADFGHRETTDWSSIRSYADGVRDEWRRYVENPTPETFNRVQREDPAHLVKVALGEVARRSPGMSGSGRRVTVRSEQPIGAGFGSSAALALAIARAHLALQENEIGDEALYELALDVERRQHGTPSGVDPATVLRGGVVWAEKGEDGLRYESVTSSSPVFDQIRVFDTGSPSESTGTVVDAVRNWRDANPEAFENALDRIEDATRTLRAMLERRTVESKGVRQSIRRVEAGLETLGVVPDPLQERIRTIENEGGAAKISGAGALSGFSAGSLLVYHPDPDAAVWEHLGSFQEIDGRLGAEGVRLERADP